MISARALTISSSPGLYLLRDCSGGKRALRGPGPGNHARADGSSRINIISAPRACVPGARRKCSLDSHELRDLFTRQLGVCFGGGVAVTGLDLRLYGG